MVTDGELRRAILRYLNSEGLISATDFIQCNAELIEFDINKSTQRVTAFVTIKKQIEQCTTSTSP